MLPFLPLPARPRQALQLTFAPQARREVDRLRRQLEEAAATAASAASIAPPTEEGDGSNAGREVEQLRAQREELERALEEHHEQEKVG